MKKYLTTGEFAQLCKVRKQTLFHYDDFGILKPEKIGKNGYRYYSYKQLETFSVISMLRDLDMSLSEIKTYQEKRSAENLKKLLKREEKIVDEKIAELQWVKHYIRKKLEITEEGLIAGVGEIFIETCSDEYFWVSEYNGSDSKLDIAKAVTEHLACCHEKDIYSAFSIGGMAKREDVELGEYEYSRFFTRIDEDGVEHNFVRSEGDYLSCYNKGFANLKEIAKMILEYSYMKNITLGKYFYEDVILDELSEDSYDDYLIKLSIKIE